MAEQSGDKMVPFLSLMVQKIYDDWEYEKRYEDRELDAGKCFDQKKGSCKDLAWMLMMMLRGAGLATRFVSGYAYNPDVDFRHELHAWVEVLLPGAGWVGMDPSAGLFADENYVPVATSFDPALTMPCGWQLSRQLRLLALKQM
ncbi:MAG: transglutaminase family protein [Balneolaceae bacterium]|nr:transglutaminase family protein [Balneolaceae bacterium]